MSNQHEDICQSAIDQSQLYRIHRDICSMNPTGVRTVYSTLPTPLHGTLVGIYDVTFGLGIEVTITRGDLVIIRLMQQDSGWNPLANIAMGGIVIQPRRNGYFSVTKNSPTGNGQLDDTMTAYDLLTMVCEQWPAKLGWLLDIRARLYPTAPDIDVPETPITDHDIEGMYWQIQPHIAVRTPEENKFHASELYIEQVQTYVNFPGTQIFGCELSVNTTPINRDEYTAERGFVVTHQPDNSSIPLVIETFNCEDDAIDANLLINIKAEALCQLRSLDNLIKYAMANTPEEGCGPSMLEDYNNAKMITTATHRHDNPDHVEPLFTTIKKVYHTNHGSPFLEYLRVKTAFHGRLTRIVIGYCDNFTQKRTNTAVYSPVPLTGKEIMQMGLDHCYQLESISGNTIESMVKWLQDLEPELAKLFG